jgi:beta-phosphoglucomutase family hydrolase
MQGMSAPLIALPGGPYEALLLDLDGVVTDTASVHSRAWKRTFDDFLVRRAEVERTAFVPFVLETDYPEYVDGKPRNDGVRSFLTSRGISLPEGLPTDLPGDTTIWAVGNSKNDVFLDVLAEQGVDVYEGSVEFLKIARTAGLKTAVVSSSANCAKVLAAANLSDLFDDRVDGLTIIERHLAGKPAPDSFLYAAQLLNVEPAKSVVFEDALAGVEAGKSGHFGLVVGVDRIGHADALKQHGADVVVQDLAEFVTTAPE